MVLKFNDSSNDCFGCLITIVGVSKCQPGALNVQSFSERIISVESLITTKDRLLLKSYLVEKLVTIGMSKQFIIFFREKNTKETSF